MIFDGLPLAMAGGGGTKMSGPHFHAFKTKAERGGVYTLRLDGEGVLTFWASFTAGVPKESKIIKSDVSSGITIRTVTLEIDGQAYAEYITEPSEGDLTGGYVDAELRLNHADSDYQPHSYIFHEYLEITITNSTSYGYAASYCFQYYDLDADNPVTVTYA